MKNDLQEHYDSIQIKKALHKLHITNVSELKEYNCVSLANKLRTDYNKLMIIRKLNDLGYLPFDENAISMHDIPMSRKMRNIFLYGKSREKITMSIRHICQSQDGQILRQSSQQKQYIPRCAKTSGHSI